jgi:hypothetical protein
VAWLGARQRLGQGQEDRRRADRPHYRLRHREILSASGRNLYLRSFTDGTVIWTSPTGHTYTTYPGSKHLFPTLCEPTGTLWNGEPPSPGTNGDRGVMMPKRRHTRAYNTSKAINAERRLNDALVAERNRPPPF